MERRKKNGGVRVLSIKSSQGSRAEKFKPSIGSLLAAANANTDRGGNRITVWLLALRWSWIRSSRRRCRRCRRRRSASSTPPNWFFQTIHSLLGTDRMSHSTYIVIINPATVSGWSTNDLEFLFPRKILTRLPLELDSPRSAKIISVIQTPAPACYPSFLTQFFTPKRLSIIGAFFHRTCAKRIAPPLFDEFFWFLIELAW